MLTPGQTSRVADITLGEYIRFCGAGSPEELAKALEMMISTAAMVIERAAGPGAAVPVLQRTALFVAPAKGRA